MAEGTVLFRFGPRSIRQVMDQLRKQARADGVDLRSRDVRRVMREVRVQLVQQVITIHLVGTKKE